MTKEDYLEIIAIYTIEKVREAKEIGGSQVFRHSAAIKHYESDNREKWLKSTRSNAFVAEKLGVTKRYVEILRKEKRDRKK